VHPLRLPPTRANAAPPPTGTDDLPSQSGEAGWGLVLALVHDDGVKSEHACKKNHTKRLRPCPKITKRTHTCRAQTVGIRPQ
jgi:hypothetical protein